MLSDTVLCSLLEDLFSILETGLHPDDPAIMMDADAIFPEEMFYNSIPRRMGSRASRFFEREFEAERERDRERDLLRRERWWSGLGLAENAGGNKNNNNSQERGSVSAKNSTKESVTFLGDLEYWPGEVGISKQK
jgi:hypothetical protein